MTMYSETQVEEAVRDTIKKMIERREIVVGLEYEMLAKLAGKLAREVKGSFELFEPLARREIGKTNYRIIVDDADAVLAALTPADGGGK